MRSTSTNVRAIEAFDCADHTLNNAPLPIQCPIKAIPHLSAILSSLTALSDWSYAPDSLFPEKSMERIAIKSFVHQHSIDGYRTSPDKIGNITFFASGCSSDSPREELASSNVYKKHFLYRSSYLFFSVDTVQIVLACIAPCECCAVNCGYLTPFITDACISESVPDILGPFCNGLLPSSPMSRFVMIISHESCCPSPCRSMRGVFKVAEVSHPSWGFLWTILVQEGRKA